MVIEFRSLATNIKNKFLADELSPQKAKKLTEIKIVYFFEEQNWLNVNFDKCFLLIGEI